MSGYSRLQSCFVVLGVYLIAIAAALALTSLFSSAGIMLSFFIADVTATIVVWLGGTLFDNASVYDPYWSVAPIALVIARLISRGAPFTPVDALGLLVMLFWGVRLTVNFFQGWKGLGAQDWRYTMFRKKQPKLFPLVNLFGICMMPTLLVYLGTAPLLKAMEVPAQPSLMSYIGVCLCVLSTILEIISDRQLRRFRTAEQGGTVCCNGLWKYTRHPNYLGEVLFWWGVFLLGAGAAQFRIWMLLGPVSITLLFLCISIPMMETHLQDRPDYAAYRSTVPPFVPIPGKKANITRTRRPQR